MKKPLKINIPFVHYNNLDVLITNAPALIMEEVIRKDETIIFQNNLY